METSNVSKTDISNDSQLSALLLAWYEVEKRDLPWRMTSNPYSIWISEVMLQQTQVKTVIPYYEKFLLRFPDVKELAAANLDDVLTVWQGLGYYTRARRLWEGAQYIQNQCGGIFPGDYESLRQIPGIGEYTAGAIASIAYGQSVNAIDGNVLRVLSRLLAWSEPVEAVRSYRRFDKQLSGWQPAQQAGDFNQALMELGAMVCTPKNPTCGNCPLAQVCEGYHRSEVLLYPVKRQKVEPKEVTRLTFVLRYNDRVYLQKRPSHGLLADLWEFPGLELMLENNLLEPKANEAKDLLSLSSWDELFAFYQKAVPERDYDGSVRKQFAQGLKLHGPVWYTFSHKRWKIIWVMIDLSERGLDKLSLVREEQDKYQFDSKQGHSIEKKCCWASQKELKELPLPIAFTSIIQVIS